MFPWSRRHEAKGGATAPTPSTPSKSPTNGVNAFGAKLLRQWREDHPDDSIIFSPLSIASAFLLLYDGALKGTRKEFENVFRFRDRTVVNSLRAKLTKFSNGSIASMANRIGVDQSIVLEQKYMMSVGPENVQSVDFINEKERVAGEINAWVSKKTKGLITELVKPSMFTEETAMVLINAICFQGQWRTSFRKNETRDSEFHGIHGTEVVPFMYQRGNRVSYKRVPELDGVMFVLPYEGDDFAMFIFLPNQKDGWKKAEQEFPAHADTLLCVTNFCTVELDVLKMPKWEFDTSIDSLRDTMTQLGLVQAFSDTANFGAITTTRPICISDAIHKAKVIVDEEGTTAAAATGMVFHCCSGMTSAFNIHVDRPFLYFIVDKSDGTVLFQGTQTSIKKSV